MTGIFASIIGAEGMTAVGFLLCCGVSLICGIICAAAAAFKSEISKSFLISLIILPVVVQTVIIMVNGNIGTGIAVMGAFSLVRFRSVPGKAKDIVWIFAAMTAGIACAAGYLTVAFIFTLLVAFVFCIVTALPVAQDKTCDLRVTVPETLNYTDAFSDVLEKYTKSAREIKVKTCNMGSMYKIYYRVEIKDKAKIKEFVDELRTRNGNLEICVSNSERVEEL